MNRSSESSVSRSSPGLALALQRAEIGRAWTILGMIGGIFLVGVLRQTIGAAPMPTAVFVARLGVLAASVAYAAGIIALVRRAEQRKVVLPAAIWGVATVFETMLPGASLLIGVLYSKGQIEHADITAPMVGFVTLGIIAVLRLRPWVCVVGGVASMLIHASLVWLVLSNEGGMSARGAVNFSHSLLILVAWLCAAFVARELRKHFVAGLREAETRAELAKVTGELEVAKGIQKRLMPREQLRLRDFEIAGWNRPADQTGGDYYDWMRIDDRRVIAFIGDVTGHGIGPALLMAACRAYARATVPEVGGLSEGVGRLNDLLANDMDDGRFITFAAAVLDESTGRVELLSAGHGPIIVLNRADGTIEALGPSGMPLGIMGDAPFEPPSSITLHAGDVFLMVTDGFVEAIDPETGKQFGTQRLSKFLADHAATADEEFLPRLAAVVDAFTKGSPQADDMTGVLIRRNE